METPQQAHRAKSETELRPHSDGVIDTHAEQRGSSVDEQMLSEVGDELATIIPDRGERPPVVRERTPLSAEIIQGFEEYGISSHELSAMDAFCELSPAAQKLVLKNFQQYAYGIIKGQGIVSTSQMEISKGRARSIVPPMIRALCLSRNYEMQRDEVKKLLGEIGSYKNATAETVPETSYSEILHKSASEEFYANFSNESAEYQLSREEQIAIIKSINEGGRSTLLSLSEAMRDSQVEVISTKMEQLVPVFVDETSFENPEVQAAAREFNFAAAEMTEWELGADTSVVESVDMQRRDKAVARYDRAMQTLTERLSAEIGEAAAIKQTMELDRKVLMMRSFNWYPDAHAELLQLVKKSTWKRVADTVFSNHQLKKMVAVKGVKTLGFMAAGFVGAKIGGMVTRTLFKNTEYATEFRHKMQVAREGFKASGIEGLTPARAIITKITESLNQLESEPVMELQKHKDLLEQLHVQYTAAMSLVKEGNISFGRKTGSTTAEKLELFRTLELAEHHVSIESPALEAVENNPFLVQQQTSKNLEGAAARPAQEEVADDIAFYEVDRKFTILMQKLLVTIGDYFKKPKTANDSPEAVKQDYIKTSILSRYLPNMARGMTARTAAAGVMDYAMSFLK